MLLRQIFEAMARTGQGKTAVVGWGRGMGHKGHMMLASSVITKAKAVGGDPYFVVSRTMGKDDPLSADEKLAIYKKVFPQQGHIFQAASDELPDLTRVLGNLNQQGYTDAVVVVGSDQVKAFQYLKNYNGKPDKSGNIAFNFNSLDVISRQETGDPSAGEEGPRATPMRNVLNDPNATPDQQFQVWRDAMSPEVSDDEVRRLMTTAKQRMDQFAAPKKKVKESLQDQINAIAAANNIKDVNRINAGQVLKLPDGSTYKVAPGDTLSKIAANVKTPAAPAASGSGRGGRGGPTAQELTAYQQQAKSQTPAAQATPKAEPAAAAPAPVTPGTAADPQSGVRQGPNPNIDQATRQRAQASVANLSSDQDVMSMVKKHEGVKNEPYKDSKGLWTVGVGHLIGDGKTLPPEWNRKFTDQEIQSMFQKDYQHHKAAAAQIPGFNNLNMNGQGALIDLTFNMGPTWWQKWPKFTQAMKAGNINQAASELVNSDWYNQVKSRAPTIVSLLKSGGTQTAESMLPKSAFAGSNKNKLGSAAHLKGKMKRPAQQGDLVGGMEEGWKSTLAGAALAGAGMLGGFGHAQAADLSGYNTQYLQSVVKGENPRPMVSVDDAKKELELRAQGKQQTLSPDEPKDHISDLNKKYTPGVTSVAGAARTFSYKDKEYSYAGRNVEPPSTDGEVIVVPAGYVGIRGLNPTKVMLGSDGKFYNAPVGKNESKLVPLSEDIEKLMGSLIEQMINNK